MRVQLALTRLDKLWQVAGSSRLTRALIRHRVFAGAEHRGVLARDLATVIDIGANRGQFALAVREWAPKARVISFEPLPGPAAIFRVVFSGDGEVVLHEAAIGLRSERLTMHISRRDDSSSLLPISDLQTAMFPGTAAIATIEVRVAPLERFVKADDLVAPVMLKLDVQGFEQEALIGCESLLSRFDLVYCECSFVELYFGQKLAWEIIDWLSIRGFGLVGVFNLAYDQSGQAVQADLLFTRKVGRGLRI